MDYFGNRSGGQENDQGSPRSFSLITPPTSDHKELCSLFSSLFSFRTRNTGSCASNSLSLRSTRQREYPRRMCQNPLPSRSKVRVHMTRKTVHHGPLVINTKQAKDIPTPLLLGIPYVDSTAKQNSSSFSFASFPPLSFTVPAVSTTSVSFPSPSRGQRRRHSSSSHPSSPQHVFLLSPAPAPAPSSARRQPQTHPNDSSASPSSASPPLLDHLSVEDPHPSDTSAPDEAQTLGITDFLNEITLNSVRQFDSFD
eukprot:GCRY01002115.1.p1 GENE.GCRY01002115.1~~GCRY01002115.1.p1  ORF type:complete len:254 (+),score=23.03 GCRY01002115.1:169-930(+)